MNNTEKYFVICTDRIRDGESRTVYMNREMGPVLWVTNMSEGKVLLREYQSDSGAAQRRSIKS